MLPRLGCMYTRNTLTTTEVPHPNHCTIEEFKHIIYQAVITSPLQSFLQNCCLGKRSPKCNPSLILPTLTIKLSIPRNNASRICTNDVHRTTETSQGNPGNAKALPHKHGLCEHLEVILLSLSHSFHNIFSKTPFC